LWEYDLDIKPTKLVKVQGLAKLMTQSISDDEEELVPINGKYLISDCYKDVVFVLQHHKAPTLTKSKARFVKLKSLRYFIFDRNCFLERYKRNFAELFT